MIRSTVIALKYKTGIIWLLQAHKMRNSIHDIDLSTVDAKTVCEVRFYRHHSYFL